MANELTPIDITKTPELAWLVEEVETTGKRRRFTRGSRTIAVVEPADKVTSAPRRRGGRTSATDPLWDIIGTVTDEGPGDVALNTDKYLADAYASTGR